MSPTHGDYDPAKGWYSANTKAWHLDPKKIGTHTPPREPTQYERDEFARSKWANGGKSHFKPQPQLDRLLKLRDSERAEDRAKYEAIAKGGTRLTLHDYEAAKAKAEQQQDGAA